MTIKSSVDYSLDIAQSAVKIFKYYFKNYESVALVSYPDAIEYKSNEYFIYIFYSCLLDYGMKSKIYHENLINTYLKYPNIFNPKYILLHSRELDNIFRSTLHVRYPRVAASKWLKLSEFLKTEENLKNKLYSFNGYQELSKYINEIGGYGQKTGGLLKRVIADAIGKYVVEEIPIDRHDIEISYLLGVSNSECLSAKDIKNLSDVWVSASKREKIDPSLVDGYLWTIGVNFCNSKSCFDCPLGKICKQKN